MTRMQFTTLQSACSLGFLADQEDSNGDSSIASSTGKASTDKIVNKLVTLAQATEPSRWTSAEETLTALSANQAVARHVRHHKEITEIFRKMYADVAYKISPSKMDLSIFRSQPYFQEIERTMEELVKWGVPDGNTDSSKGKKSGGGDRQNKSGGERKMGFGK